MFPMIQGAVLKTALSTHLNSDGNRIYLGNFDENGPNCNNWWDENRNDNIGFFPLMVDKV